MFEGCFGGCLGIFWGVVWGGCLEVFCNDFYGVLEGFRGGKNVVRQLTKKRINNIISFSYFIMFSIGLFGYLPYKSLSWGALYKELYFWGGPRAAGRRLKRRRNFGTRSAP